MIVDEKWMRRNYDMLNDKYWGGKLPKNLVFKTSMANKTWGFASYHINRLRGELVPTSITLSNYYDSPEKIKQGTLLHEMVHIADYTFHPEHFLNKRKGYDAHGPVFFLKEAARLNKDGWDIQKYVSQDEKDSSEMSDAAKARAERSLKRVGGFVNVVKLTPKLGKGKIVYMKPPAKDDIDEMIPRAYKRYYSRADLYKTDDMFWVAKRGAYGKGVYPSGFDESKLTYVRTIYNDNTDSQSKPASSPASSNRKFLVFMIIVKGQNTLVFKRGTGEDIDEVIENYRREERKNPDFNGMRIYECDDENLYNELNITVRTSNPALTKRIMGLKLVKSVSRMNEETLKRLIRETIDEYIDEIGRPEEKGNGTNIVNANVDVRNLGDGWEEVSIE